MIKGKKDKIETQVQANDVRMQQDEQLIQKVEIVKYQLEEGKAKQF